MFCYKNILKLKFKGRSISGSYFIGTRAPPARNETGTEILRPVAVSDNLNWVFNLSQ